MIQFIKVKGNANRPTMHVPSLQMQFSSSQFYWILGINMDKWKIVFEKNPGIKQTRLGTLSEVNATLQMHIRNSLVENNWNFKKFPDPDILYLEKKRSLKIHNLNNKNNVRKN